MNARLSLLAAACALALSACGGESEPATQPAATSPGPVAADTTPAATPADPSAAVDASATDCGVGITGNDAMQFDTASIEVPSSCSEFTITLTHVGQMPVAAMGHNVVVSQASDREAIATAGMAAGVEGDYLPADDARVIAHTELVGGGQSTSVTFPVSALQGDGPYEFFCSFPGHWAMMRGTIQVV